MKAALNYSNMITTVSKSYSREIQTYEMGHGLDGLLRHRSNCLTGIVNGIDCDLLNPATDKRIFAPYSATDISGKRENKLALQRQLNLPERDDVPVMSIISRLTDQKGMDLIGVCKDELLSRDIQLIVLGTGENRYEHMFRELSIRYPHKVSANILFNEDLAQRIYAGSDLFLMPSLFEPCGLSQLIAMRYGALPVVRETGGLSDTVIHYNTDEMVGNGFSFRDYLASGLMWAINEALGLYYNKGEWARAVKNAMTSDFSWKHSAKEYMALYKRLV